MQLLSTPVAKNIASAFSDSPLSTPSKTPARGVAMGFVDNVDGENNDDDGDSYMLGEGEFYVEAIVDRRGARDSSKLRYRIRWKGYGSDEDTWEAKRDINAKSLVDDYDRLHPFPQVTDRKKRIRQPNKKSLLSPGRPSTSRLPYNEDDSRNKRRRGDHETTSPAPALFVASHYDASEYLIPEVYALAEPAFRRILRDVFKTQRSDFIRRRAIVVHPASLVAFRSRHHQTSAKPFMKAGLDRTLSAISLQQMGVLDPPSLPEDVFSMTKLDIYTKAGEAYKLAWGHGLEHWFQEADISGRNAVYIVNAIVDLQTSGRIRQGSRIRFLVRKKLPNFVQFCKDAGVEVVDMETLNKELKHVNI
ncbi:Chromodomain Y-like protein 2 [Cystobasidiomycetes sp. EMM_F5]